MTTAKNGSRSHGEKMDLKHVPELRDTGAYCVNCDIELPLDIAGLGEIVELGGAGIHWVPDFAYDGKSQPCTNGKRGKALVVCVLCDGEGCEECNGDGVVVSTGAHIEAKTAEPRRGERMERAPKKTEVEKASTRMASNNFWAMREATNPNGGQ